MSDYTATSDLFVQAGVKAFDKGATVPGDNAFVSKWLEEDKLVSVKTATKAKAEVKEA